MKNFIEVHDKEDNEPRLVNIRHITEVKGSHVYTDDSQPFVCDFVCIECVETYEEIKALILSAELN